MLWLPGEPYTVDAVEEVVRNLRASLNYSVVAAVPVASDVPGVVDILVVTRDTWSLRGNFNLAVSDGVVDQLLFVPSENNFLGLHKRIGATFLWEQDTVSIGPMYADPRVGGSRLTLDQDLQFIINHDTGELEGTSNLTQLELPLYSLRSVWGFRLAEAHLINIDRTFIGSRLRTYDNPSTDAIEEIPFIVDQTILDVVAEGYFSQGYAFKRDLVFGYGFEEREYRLESPSASEADRQAFAEEVLPRDQRNSFVSVSHDWYQARYETIQNYQTYAFTETYRTGPRIF
ncbi:MAG: hypothetical protein KC561_21235, partial [Myxococcales bacterium]|nr:hypothetical protein [Myxococcales bacterium]